ncbi:hypothetical protein B0T19DRAFT_402473 [Cercophora scortea]|uniref:PAS domain-containing protein n=1 Tax=Cercophora scortea TaxID=314031 RepID=A0AAE0IFW1_9PEZI|nr:hypothetical protein B0T19DRAFT_402473 [Cercophora scortea]
MDPRDQTFMTIHNVTPDANILFASDSIFDILGYQPDEVQGRSSFEYFHPDEVPFARSIHRRGVLLDKAAVLHYARIRAKDGRWVSCECCFTIVHDVLVACTSIYLRGTKSERRAINAPQIRRLFSSSPRDPRYHMLEHLSPKFKMPPTEREPRAALILNRFTRNLSIMFATNAVTSILGLRPDQIQDKAFYELIQENCLQNAIQCLESAKANESIAYLRFSFRNPIAHEDEQEGERDGEEEDDYDSSNSSTDDSEDGVAQLDHESMDVDGDEDAVSEIEDEMNDRVDHRSQRSASIGTSSDSAYQTPLTPRSPAATAHGPRSGRQETFELEAVVSCTSDGLVVVLRRARPQIPISQMPLIPAFNFEDGMCAAPWGQRPIEPYVPPELLYTFRPPLLPQHMPLRESVKAAGGPPINRMLESIRDVAVFAWALAGINGNIAKYSDGVPRGEAQPPDGLPIWDPNAGETDYQGPENQAEHSRSLATSRRLESDRPALSHNASYPGTTRTTTPQTHELLRRTSSSNYTYSGQQHQPQTSHSSPSPYTPSGYALGQQQVSPTFINGGPTPSSQGVRRLSAPSMAVESAFHTPSTGPSTRIQSNNPSNLMTSTDVPNAGPEQATHNSGFMWK